MSANRKKLIISISLLLLCIFGCIGFTDIAQKGSEGKAPIRELRITLNVNQHEELFIQLEKFADKHDFEFLVRSVEVIPAGIFIEMYRDDLEISAVSVPDSPTKIDLNFYERDSTHPTSTETVDELLNDLKSFIGEIPNVTVTEEQ